MHGVYVAFSCVGILMMSNAEVIFNMHPQPPGLAGMELDIALQGYWSSRFCTTGLLLGTQTYSENPHPTCSEIPGNSCQARISNYHAEKWRIDPFRDRRLTE